jgi:SET domain-containing protein
MTNSRLVRRQADVLAAWIYPKPSIIQGIGAFAERNIKKGTKLFWRVPVLKHEDYQVLTRLLTPKQAEFFLTTENAVYDIRNSVLRYMNHSDKPNIDWSDGYIVTLNDIRKDDELTINYGWDHYEWDQPKAVFQIAV